MFPASQGRSVTAVAVAFWRSDTNYLKEKRSARVCALVLEYDRYDITNQSSSSRTSAIFGKAGLVRRGELGVTSVMAGSYAGKAGMIPNTVDAV